MKRRLIKIGRVSVKNALGFFWCDTTKIYVAATPEDIDNWKARLRSSIDQGGAKLRPMEELEQAYRKSSALRFISWCDTGCIVRQGAKQVTFDYGSDKVVFHVR